MLTNKIILTDGLQITWWLSGTILTVSNGLSLLQIYNNKRGVWSVNTNHAKIITIQDKTDKADKTDKTDMTLSYTYVMLLNFTANFLFLIEPFIPV